MDRQTYDDVHRWADNKIKNYIEFPRRNYASVPSCRDIMMTLRREVDFALYANNCFSRIRFSKIVAEHFAVHQGIQEGRLFMVTFTVAEDAFEIRSPRLASLHMRALVRAASPAATYNIQRLQQRVRQALHGLPFIGMTEVALFKQWGPMGRSRLDWASWHAHVFVWGVERADIAAAVAGLRVKHQSILEWVSPVHIRELASDELERHVLYPLKAPQKATEVAWFDTYINPVTGEVKPAGWHAQKDLLRTGDRVRLLDIMGERTLDKLLFGGGDGMALVHAIREEALRPWEAHKRVYRH